ncbi:hypothetical protein A5652_13060 [Mycobacterium sp. 1165178.9]|nr:hypothetical protein A5652_13060 [Mycobacterium sp. 1165178.9]
MVLAGLISLVGLVLSACTVNPPPAPQSTDTPHNSVPPPPRVSEIRPASTINKRRTRLGTLLRVSSSRTAARPATRC